MTDRIWLPDGFVELPCLFDRYELVEKLGEGGMAEVYLARKRGPGRFHKWVVVKRILPQMASSSEYRSMFEREAEVGARLDHAHIVHCYDYGEAHGSPFIIMEYVDGMSLRSVAERIWGSDLRVPLDFACSAIGDVALALDAMHTARDEAGNPLELVHRDVSGDNLVLARSGHVKLIDFGIAKGALTRAVTTVGELKGKLAYMAPEQARQGKASAKSDVFSLGVTAYWLMTRRHPFRRSTDIATLQAVVDFSPPLAQDFREDLPPPVADLLGATLEKKPKNRPTAAEVADGLYAAFPTSRMRMADVVRRLLERPDAKTALEFSMGGRAQHTEQHAVSRMSDELSWIAEVDDLEDGVFVKLERERGQTSIAKIDPSKSEVILMTKSQSTPERSHLTDASAESELTEAREMGQSHLTEDDAPSTDDISGSSIRTPAHAISAPGAHRPSPVVASAAMVAAPKNRRVILIAATAALSALLLGVTVVAVDVALSVTNSETTTVATGANANTDDGEGEPGEAVEPGTGPDDESDVAADADVDDDDDAPVADDDRDDGDDADDGENDDRADENNGNEGDVPNTAEKPPRTESETKRKGTSSRNEAASPSRRTRSVQLDAPSRVTFSTLDGHRVGRGGQRVDVPRATSSLRAVDKKTGGTHTIPIVKSRASLSALKSGTLEIRVSPFAEVRIGTKDYGVTPFAPVQLKAGEYTVRLVSDKRQRKERVTVTPSKKTLLKVRF